MMIQLAWPSLFKRADHNAFCEIFLQEWVDAYDRKDRNDDNRAFKAELRYVCLLQPYAIVLVRYSSRCHNKRFSQVDLYRLQLIIRQK